ncbi:MAG TPA: hypothetical protein VMK16_15625 [Acidimicrobiales bacterium]|nr:hypothetical protein [Acidimicrobiales bacterium]
MTAPINPAIPGSPTVEKDLALHMAKRALPVAPMIILAALLIRGVNGGWTAALAVAIVVVNLIVAAGMFTWAARLGANALMVVALGGFLFRMMLITGLVYAVRDEPWIDLPTLAVAILVTQLGLLAWECHYIATSLAVPDYAKETQAP